MNGAKKRILIAGPPRSGTTWVANVLATAPGVSLSIEPDNEKTSLLARICKKDLPRFPTCAPGETHPGYELLWRWAFDSRMGPFFSRSWLTRAAMLAGDRVEASIARKPVSLPLPAGAEREDDISRAPNGSGPRRLRVVKSVHSILCLDWVCETFRPDPVVVLRRHPLAVIDSWRRLNMPDAARLWSAGLAWLEHAGAAPVEDADDPIVRMALQAGLMYRCLDDFCEARSDVIRIDHESLCRDPAAGFEDLFRRCGLPWTQAVLEGIEASNREGEGYRPVRLAHREVGKWQGQFTSAELERVTEILEAFHIALPAH